MRENADAKARRYLSEGRVRILEANETDAVIVANVRGNGSVYTTLHDGTNWSCNCAAYSVRCAHVRALELLTAFAPRKAHALSVVAVALTNAERVLAMRAVGELADREGVTDTTVDLLELLANALPLEVFGELVEAA